MNILWQQENGSLALTSILTSDTDPKQHAEELQSRGNVPSSFVMLALNVTWAEQGWPHECYGWDGKEVVVDLECAKDFIRSQVRIEREPLLRELDAKWMIASEDGDEDSKKECIEAKRILRSATEHPLIAQANNLATLRNVTLKDLM